MTEPINLATNLKALPGILILRTFLFIKLYAQTTPCAIFEHPILQKKGRKLHFYGAPKYPKEKSEHNVS